MVTVTERITVASGGIGEALEWSSKAFKTITEAGLAPARFTMLRPQTGHRNASIIFASRYDSLSEYEELEKKMYADSGYMALIKETRKLDWFVGSERQIYYVIETTD